MKTTVKIKEIRSKIIWVFLLDWRVDAPPEPIPAPASRGNIHGAQTIYYFQ